MKYTPARLWAAVLQLCKIKLSNSYIFNLLMSLEDTRPVLNLTSTGLTSQAAAIMLC